MLDNQDPFQVPLASIVASEAQRAGIKVAGHDSITTPTGAVYTGEIEKILESKPQAVFLSGDSGAGSAGLWQQLHAADPQLLLLGTSSMASESFASAIGTAGSRTYLTTPCFPPRSTRPRGSGCSAPTAPASGSEGGPWALYGFVAMRTVLESVRSAGSKGNDRAAVTERFFATRAPHSAIGPFAIQANGETTSTVYAVDRVSAGRLVFQRALSATPAPAPPPTG